MIITEPMKIIDIGKQTLKSKIEAGTVLILQGSPGKAMNILHSGLAEVLSYQGDTQGKEAVDIIENSIRVGLIRGESVYGILGIRNPGPYNTSIRAVTDCIVSINPVKQEDLLPTLQSKISFNIQVLRALNQRIESALYLFKNYKYLWHKFASILDCLALVGNHEVNLDQVPEASRESSSLPDYASYLKQLAARKNVAVPDLWDSNVFLGRVQQELELYRDHDNRTIETLVDYSQVLFIKRLVQKNDTILVPLFKGDEPMNFYIFQFMSDVLETMLQENVKLVTDIRLLIDRLFQSGGWIDETLKTQKDDSVKANWFNLYLEKFCWRCHQDTNKLLGINLKNKYPVFSNLKHYVDIPIDTGDLDEDQTIDHSRSAADTTDTLKKYNGLFRKILDFSTLNSEFKESFTANMTLFKKCRTKLEKSPEMNNLRKEIADQYWQLYENCFLRVIDTDLKGFIPGIMLHFGLIDETLVTEKDLEFLDKAYAGNLCSEASIPVITLPYFLEKIYRSELNPSISEMGESFNAVLKRQEKQTKKERAASMQFEDTAEGRVRYEIQSIVKNTAKLLFGSKLSSIPFLCSEAFPGDMSRIFLETETFTSQLDRFRKRDFSVFYRELILRHKYGTDFIRKEVAPYFVLYPVSGTRNLLWQELDGVKKDTHGRVFFPLVFSGKLEEDILSIYAQFRWELQKTISGVKWTDPIEGGVVGIYYDYINFYKKNPKLTPQAKENIREFISKTRSDRERFSLDYQTWIKYEYEGRLRMNPAVREIFYRFCPFPVSVRKEMAKKPIFADLDMKYNNRIRKEILKMETRRKKFENSNVPVPEDLTDYLAFLEA